MSKFKKYTIRGMVAMLILATFLISRDKTPIIQVTKAGSITNPTWTVSSSTLSATSVTYTHTFTTETVIPSCSEPGSCGNVEINFSTPPGPSSFPDFSAASVTITSGGTTFVDNRALDQWSFYSGNGWASLNLRTDTTAIPAGNITVSLSGVTNPSSGGVIQTNTVTTNNGMELDGKRNSTNSSILIGSVSLSGYLKNAGGTGVEGVRVEVHSQFGCIGGQNCFWQSTTDSSGQYRFAGIPAGTYVFEMSPGFDMTSSTANQYSRFDPVDVTIDEDGLILGDITLTVSQKKIVGVVKYAGTSTAIRGANVNSFSMGKGGFAMGQTGSDGSFELKVAYGKSFFVMVMPMFGGGPGGPGGEQQFDSDFLPQSPRQVNFQNEGNVAETIDMGTVTVERADATVTGRLVDPSGNAISNMMGGMGAMNFQSHVMVPVMVQPDGSFSFKAKSGTGNWKLERFDPGASYAMPETEFGVSAGANNLGDIRMVALDKTITVTTIRQTSGEVVPNIPVYAFRSKKPGPPFMSFTDSNGVAIVKVPTGFEGRVMANPGGEGGPGKRSGGEGGGEGPRVGFLKLVQSVYAEKTMFAGNASQLYPVTPPKKVKAGDSVTFEFALADKTVQVKTLKKGTSQLMTDGGFANARPTSSGFDGFGGGFGGPTAGGIGTLYTTAGEYEFNAFFPPESDWVGIPETATIGNEGGSVDIETVQKTVTITGEIQDASNDNAVIKDSALNIMIGVFGRGAFSMGSYDPSTGRYTAKFAPEIKFRLGVAAGDPGMGVQNGGYIPNISPIELEGTDGQTITQNLTLAKVDAVISGTVKDQNGAGVGGVTVYADPGLADVVGPEGEHGPGGVEEGPEFGFSDVTADDGTYSINVSANKYNLVVNGKDQGLFPTGITQTTIAARETKTGVDITMAVADSKIDVEVNNKDGQNLLDSEVQVFNDKGTIAFNAEVGDDGKVIIDVPADTYTIKAGKDAPEDGTVEESAFIKVISLKDQTVNQTLQTTTQTDTLAKPITQEVSSTSTATVSLQKGGAEQAALEIPSGALSSSSSSGGEEGEQQSTSGNPIITVSPIDAQAVATKVDFPIRGITVDAIDGDGNQISTLAGMVTGRITYDENTLPPGVTESKLEVKSFNEDSGQWEQIASSAVDSTNNVVTFATTHFSDFAIVATTDTTSPSAPSNISATGGDAKVTLSWTNPSDSDFAGVKVYRSTTSGTIGDLVTTTTGSTTSYENTGLTNSTRYYYTVRSYDTAGNISTNTTQVNAMPSASGTLPSTGPSESSSSSQTWQIVLVLVMLGLGGLITFKRFKNA